MATAPSDLALQPVNWRSLVTAPTKPIEYHWDGWVPARSIALVAGAGESAKSWLTLYLSLCGAAEIPAFGEAHVQPGPAIYVAAETSLEEEQRRCQLLKSGLDLPDELPYYLVSDSEFSLEHQYGALIELVERVKPVMLTFDSAIAISNIVWAPTPASRQRMKPRLTGSARKRTTPRAPSS